MVVLSDTELKKLLPNSVLKHFKGIFMSDQFPPRRAGYYIFNLDNSKGDASDSPDSIGNHWVGLVVKTNESYYFDPYGKPPDESLVKWLKIRRPKYRIWYSTSPVQSIDSSNCGFYVLSFLTDMSEGVSFYDTIHKYKLRDTAQNERIIKSEYNIDERHQRYKTKSSY
jgi:hypothetical protein